MENKNYCFITIYFDGEVVAYKGENYKIEIPDFEKKYMHKISILGENPANSRFFRKQIWLWWILYVNQRRFL